MVAPRASNIALGQRARSTVIKAINGVMLQCSVLSSSAHSAQLCPFLL